MNYVGKPLALVLATPEQPDDADNTLRAAFGNEATERDIDEFARRFGCRVVDSFGSSEFAVVMREERGVRRTRRARRRPVMAAIVLNEAVALSPKRFEEFLASQPICRRRRGRGTCESTLRCRRRRPARSSSAR